MKYIANILTDEPFSGNELYNVVAEENGLIPGMPTLIIGWDRVKEMYPDASIIEWNVTGDVYWTYGKYDRRDKYEACVKKFGEIAFKRFSENLSYVFYDVMCEGNERFDSFINLLKGDKKKTIYASNDMLYVYIEGTRSVFGLSLRDCDYIGPDLKKRIFSAIYDNNSVTILKNNEQPITRDVKYKLSGMLYAIAYIYS